MPATRAALKTVALSVLLVSTLAHVSPVLNAVLKAAPRCCCKRGCCGSRPSGARTCVSALCTCGGRGIVLLPVNSPPAVQPQPVVSLAPFDRGREHPARVEDRIVSFPPAATFHPPPFALS